MNTDFDEVQGNREVVDRGFCTLCNAHRYDEEGDHTCHVCGTLLVNITPEG